jgi:hypothetical protein
MGGSEDPPYGRNSPWEKADAALIFKGDICPWIVAAS